MQQRYLAIRYLIVVASTIWTIRLMFEIQTKFAKKSIADEL